VRRRGRGHFDGGGGRSHADGAQLPRADGRFASDCADQVAWADAVAMEFQRARRHSRPASVLMLDIDHFKQVNDRHGHSAGDDVILEKGTTVTVTQALGGTVSANPVREIGWHPVRKLSNDAAQSWLDGLPANMELFHWHGETFSVPEGAEILLESDFCARQAFASGNTLALQCHVEMTAPMVREWASLYRHELDDPSPAVQSAGTMTKNLDEKIAGAQQVADHLYLRWLRPLLG